MQRYKVLKGRLRFRIPKGQRKKGGSSHEDFEAGRIIAFGPEDRGVNIENLVRLGYIEPVAESPRPKRARPSETPTVGEEQPEEN